MNPAPSLSPKCRDDETNHKMLSGWPSMSGLSEYDREWCTKIHAELLKWPMASPFRSAVDPVRDNAPSYYDIITNPMDLTKMKRKLTEGSYKTVSDFVSDAHLICENAIKFNGDASMLACIAMDLKEWIDAQYRAKPNSSDDEWHRKLVDVIDRLRDHVQQAPAAFRGIDASVDLPLFC
jgi:transcription initiation factor TFIID subunit 2